MTRLLTLLSATLLLLNACCPVTSEHPLSGPADSVYDRNLAGTWKSDDGELFFHIGKGEGNRVKVIAVEHGSDTKMDAAIFSILTTAVKKEHYLSIDLAALPKKTASDYTGYILARYDFPDRDTVRFQPIDMDALADAILAKRIAGDITYQEDEVQPKSRVAALKDKRKVACARITDTPANIRAFLASEDRDPGLFSDPVILKRVK